MFNAFPLNLISIQNPYWIPTNPWGFITVPIPIPFQYPWESPWEFPYPRQPWQQSSALPCWLWYSYCIPTAFYTFWWSRSRRIEMASHFKSCPNIPSASRMSGNAHRMHLDCCQNLIPYEKNAAGMPFKCCRKLSIAARTCLECSRNVPSCSRVTDDVIQNNAESLRLFFEHRQKTFSVCSLHWGFAWSTSRHAVNEKRSYEVHHWLKVRSPRSSWRASSCCWRCPAPSESEDETMGHPLASHFPDGHSGCAWVFYSKLLHESVVMSMQPSPLLCQPRLSLI